MEPYVELPIGPRSAALGVADACGHPHWGLGWRSLWGHQTLYWVWRAHVITPAGASRGAPYGARQCCTGCGRRTWPPPLGPHVELPMGPRSA
eukprot:5312775-Pyramimonas_sp.AAC.1